VKNTKRKRNDKGLFPLPQIIDQIHGAVISTDMDGYVMSWNKGAERLYGYLAEEALGKHISLLSPREQHEFLRQQVIKPLKEKGNHEIEVCAIKKSGEECYVHLSLSLLKDGHGTARRMIGYSIDIAERKRAEIALHESEARYQRLAENALDVIYRYRLFPDRGCEYINPATTTITGFTPEEHYADPDLIFKIVHPEDASKVCDGFQNKKLFGTPLLLRWIQKNGKPIWTEQSIVPVCDPAGNIIAIEGITRDITHRKQAEEALLQSENNLVEAQRIAHLGNWVWDMPTNELRWSDEVYRIFGLDPADSRDPKDLFNSHVPPEDQQRIDRAITDTMARRAPFSLDHRVLRPDGIERIVDERGEVFYDQGGQGIRMVGTVHDVTERKQAEEALRKSEAKNRALVSAIPDLMFCVSRDGTYLDFKPGKDIESYVPPDQFLGKKIHEVLPAQTAQRAMSGVERAFQTGDMQIVEYDLSHGGTLKHFEARIVVSGADEVLAIVRDITERKQAEEALRESEIRLRLISDHIHEVVYKVEMTDEDPYNGTVQFVSASVRDILGYWPDEFLADATLWFRLVHPEDVLALEETTRAIYTAKKCAKRVYRLRRKDCDEYRWMEDLVVPQLDDTGNVIGIFGVARDVTESKQTEELLRKSQAQLAGIIRSARDAIITIDEDQHIVIFNSAAEKMFGSRTEEATGKPIDQFIPVEFREAHQKHVRGFGQDNIANRQMGMSLDLFGVRSDGQKFPIEVSISKLADDGRMFYTAIIRDITERKRIEKQLRIKEVAIGSAINAISIADLEGNVIYANDSALRLWGYDNPQEVMGKPAVSFWKNEEEVSQVIRGLKELGYWIGELVAKRKDGVYLELQTATNTVTDEVGTPLCVMGSFVDVTERKRLEEALRESKKLAATGRMAARIAHEINNPLAGIKNSFLLLRSGLDKEHLYYAYADRIEKEIDRIARIIHQMYDLYRPERELEKEFAVEEVIQDVVELLKADCHEKAVTLRVEAPGTPIRLLLPEGFLRQVLFNIMHNAIDASSPRGVVTVRLAVSRQEATITVADQGEGIPKDLRSRIFEPFFSTKSGEKNIGLGLGLSTSRSLVESMKGSLDFRSNAIEGTVFRIILPFSKKSNKARLYE